MSREDVKALNKSLSFTQINESVERCKNAAKSFTGTYALATEDEIDNALMGAAQVVHLKLRDEAQTLRDLADAYIAAIEAIDLERTQLCFAAE